jgi:hypothetical protein
MTGAVKLALKRAAAGIDLLRGEIGCGERTDPEEEIRRPKGSR